MTVLEQMTKRLADLGPEALAIMGGVAALLLLATVIGLVLKTLYREGKARETIDNINQRIRAWWIMVVIFAAAVITGGAASILLFAVTSVLALHEFRRIVGAHPSDNRTWFWLFAIVIPIHYLLLIVGWYGLFVMFIPVYVFLFVPIRSVLRDDTDQFLERIACMQWGLMACVYCLSHAPAVLILDGETINGAGLLLFLVTVVELCDVSQYIWGKSLGRHKIAPNVSPNKTYEGFFGGVLTAACVGMLLSPVTPFTLVESFGVALALAVAGFLGDLTLSAIKRSRRTKDFGRLLPGHGGILDRIDSLVFAAPIFFHYARYYHG